MRLINAEILAFDIKVKRDWLDTSGAVGRGEYIALNKALAIIDEQPTIDVDVKHEEWIPCSERLPSKKEIVLITNSKGNVRCGQFRGTYEKYWTWKGNTLETVVAWMPLPEPWKGAERWN